MPRDTSGEWKEDLKILGLMRLDSESHRLYDSQKLELFVENLLSSHKELWLGRSKEEMEKLKVGVPEFADKYLQGCEITLKNSNEKKFDAVSMKDIHNETLDEAVSALSSLSEGKKHCIKLP